MAKITDSSYALATLLDTDDTLLGVEDGLVRRVNQDVMLEWMEAVPFTPVAATGATEAIDWNNPVHELTMDQACTFSFSNLPADNVYKSILVHLRGAFTPTFPASCDFAGTPATYATPSLYVMECWNGTDVLVTVKGVGYA